MIVSYSYKETILFLFVKSVVHTNTESYFYFISTSVTDVFSVYISLSSAISTLLALLLLVYHLLLFISPALFKFEYDSLKKVVGRLLLFWLFSTLLFYSFLFCVFWEFFLSFQSSNVHQPLSVYFEAKINDYVELYLFFYFVCIVLSQLFAVLFCFLEFVDRNNKMIKNIRKLAYVTFIGLATLLTPPDIFSQISVFLIFAGFYEVMFIISIVNSKFN